MISNIAEAIAAGIEYQRAGQLDQAEHIYRQIHAAVPRHADPPHLLGAIARQRGDLDRAARYIQQAVALNPDSALLHSNLGTVYAEMDRHVEAEQCHRRATQLAPQSAEAHYNLGNTLAGQGALAEADAAFRQALDINPKFVEAHNNLGNVLRHQMRLDEALASYAQALAIDPDHADAHWNRALVWLQNGRFDEGWREYDWRLKRKQHKQRGFKPPIWDGSDLRGRRILLVDEQGIGDTVMFASCIDEVVQRAAGCIVECKPRLLELFTRSFPKATVLPKPLAPGDVALADVDWQVFLGSLPRYLRRDPTDCPRHSGYLRPSATAVEQWWQRLARLGSGLKIGISWRGGVESQERRAKSTTLDAWKDVLALGDVHLINLQYGDCQSELAQARCAFDATIHDFPEANLYGNMHNVAALISALDLVISVPNTNVHLAGALGVPVWLALPYAPQWRWLLGRDDSPWYPSVRIFRRAKDQPWADLLATIAALVPRTSTAPCDSDSTSC